MVAGPLPMAGLGLLGRIRCAVRGKLHSGAMLPFRAAIVHGARWALFAVLAEDHQPSWSPSPFTVYGLLRTRQPLPPVSAPAVARR